MITYELGKNYYETDEQSQAERSLLEAINILGIPKQSTEEKESKNEIQSEMQKQDQKEIQKEDEKQDQKEEQKEEKKEDQKEDQQEDQQEEQKEDKKEDKIHDVDAFTPNPISFDFVFEYADACNYLGMIWTNRANYKKSEACFRLAEAIYENCKRYVLSHI